MNEPNNQHSEAPPAEQVLTEIIRLRKEAYAEGFRNGYQRGFEYGASVAMASPNQVGEPS